jgi:tetratricopeptide (TPR) repeat protein
MIPATSTLARWFALALLLWVCAVAATEIDEVRRLHSTGRTAEALQRAEQFLAAAPRDAEMRFMHGVLLADSGRTEQAKAVWLGLTEDEPELAEPYNNLAALYAQTGQLDEALFALQQAVRNNPVYATALENLGDVQVMLAREAYARAARLEPLNAALATKLAMTRVLLGTGASQPRNARP